MPAEAPHRLAARRVKFDLSASPVHWLPDDAFSSQLLNGIHLLLPAGELWFCRVYNKALRYVSDPQLRADVEGFIRQEGTHAQVHRRGEAWLRERGYDVDAYRGRVDRVFEEFLGETPLAIPSLKGTVPERQWLLLRVGLIAAIEHFTGVIGDWCMNSDAWDRGDAVVADLFRWHLAEEVEHRTVAFDLYRHLCGNELSFYLSRQLIMAAVFPLFFHFIIESGRSLWRQDGNPEARQLAQRGTLPLLLELQRVGRKNGNVPTMSFILGRTARWLSPAFHPIHEGDTSQALAYIARSPAARAAE